MLDVGRRYFLCMRAAFAYCGFSPRLVRVVSEVCARYISTESSFELFEFGMVVRPSGKITEVRRNRDTDVIVKVHRRRVKEKMGHVSHAQCVGKESTHGTPVALTGYSSPYREAQRCA